MPLLLGSSLCKPASRSTSEPGPPSLLLQKTCRGGDLLATPLSTSAFRVPVRLDLTSQRTSPPLKCCLHPFIYRRIQKWCFFSLWLLQCRNGLGSSQFGTIAEQWMRCPVSLIWQLLWLQPSHTITLSVSLSIYVQGMIDWVPSSNVFWLDSKLSEKCQNFNTHYCHVNVNGIVLDTVNECVIFQKVF